MTEDWPFFVWSTNRSESFTNFAECAVHWEKKKMVDPSLNLTEIFKFKLPNELDRKGRGDPKGIMDDLLHMDQYAHIEDLFECSGMCQAGLFYYSRPISEGYPEKTCLA